MPRALEQVDLLLRIAKATQKLVNKEHERRKQRYERTGMIDTGIKHAYWNQDYAQLKELIGSKNFDEALRLVVESCRRGLILSRRSALSG